MSRYHIQPRIPGLTRIGTYSALMPQIRRALDKLAYQYGVRRSWVAATLLADALGISDQPDFRYRTPKATRHGRQRRSRKAA